jgi:hypothetical protein
MIAVAGVNEEKSRPANLQPVKEALEFFVESLPKQAKANARSIAKQEIGRGPKEWR